jgi:hypothetical protein
MRFFALAQRFFVFCLLFLEKEVKKASSETNKPERMTKKKKLANMADKRISKYKRIFDAAQVFAKSREHRNDRNPASNPVAVRWPAPSTDPNCDKLQKFFVFKLHTRPTSFCKRNIKKSINAFVHAHGEIKFIRLMFGQVNSVGKGS